MNDYFLHPQTTGEWLLSSLGWTALSLGSWWGGSYVLARWPRGGALEMPFTLLGFVLAHLLIWRYAVLSGWLLVGWEVATVALGLKMAASLWLAVLLLFQVLCTVLMLGVLAVML